LLLFKFNFYFAIVVTALLLLSPPHCAVLPQAKLLFLLAIIDVIIATG